MNAEGFASLHSGMLMRKGRAEPSAPSSLSMPGKSDPASTAPGFSADRRDSDPQQSAASRLKIGSCVESADTSLGGFASGRLSAGEARALRFAAAMLDCSEESLVNEAVWAHLARLADTALRQCPCFRKRLDAARTDPPTEV